MQETSSGNYLVRTEWNVRDSDGTAIFSLSPSLSGGSKRTLNFAMKHRKPHLHIHPGVHVPAAVLLRFIEEHGIKTLNVA